MSQLNFIFVSIAYVCENKSSTKGFELRKLVGNIIAENPKVFTEDFLGTPTYEYASLINHPGMKKIFNIARLLGWRN